MSPRFSGHHGSRQSDEEEVKPLKITNTRMLGWFYKNLKPHWVKVSMGLLAMLVGTAAGLYVPMILRSIFDDVIRDQRMHLLPGLIGQYLLFMIGGLVFSAVRTNVMHLLGQRFVYNVRMDCYSNLLRLGLNYFESKRSGDIMSRISNDVEAVELMVVHGTDDIISNTLHIIGSVGFLLYLDWKMALVALAPLPFYVVCMIVLARYIRPVFGKIRKELGEINAKLQERIAGIQVIKAFAREEPEKAFFDESNRAYWRASAKSIWIWSTCFPALSLLTSVGLVLLMWYGARRAALGTGLGAVSAGTVVAFLSYMQHFYRPVSSLGQVQNIINRALASLARIFELMDEQPSVKDKEDAIELQDVQGKVELQGVSFKYDTGEMVLRNVSVSAEPGEVVAIVGRSGAGKTSLVNLIARFYDPCEGRVVVDGHDVRDVTQNSLRRNIGMVLQETFLFNDTVRENIRYAKPDATDEEVVEAAQGAYAHAFISRFEKGYDTIIGERGVRLSGGERQRIAIARAFLVNPRILILDEATSQVDTEAEQVIQKALNSLMENRTVFIIAHRLSTVRRADKIVVIDDGQVVEQDDHESLMAKGGLYSEMVTRQFQMDEEVPDDIPPGFLR